ncbi:MAG: hypothetical protein ACTSVM_03930 [Candidatus Ranarchaeia archaeon]
MPEPGGSPPILTQEQITHAIPDNTYADYTMNQLEQMGLLNIPAGSRQQIQLASLVGHLLGDGTLLITKEGGRVIFRASDPRDIRDLWDTVNSLGMQPTKIQETKITGRPIHHASGRIYEPHGKLFFFEIRRKPVAIAFNALGVPVGDRIKCTYPVPEWIINGPKMVKRAFLRAYFGADMSTPRLHSHSPKTFNQLVIKTSKIEELSNDEFVNGIKALLADFGVEMSSVNIIKGNIRKDGYKTKVYECNIASGDENMFAFFSKIGFEYAHVKEEWARLASEYLAEKIAAKQKVRSKIREALRLKKGGASNKEIAEILGVPSSRVSGWVKKVLKDVKVPREFPKYFDWVKTASAGLDNGLVWDTVTSIEETDLDLAYDITTADDNHNFVASSILTNNCPPYNADFDGDEMNLHVPQGEEARAEARTLMRVQEQILSPRYGGPIIGAIQDFISASFMLTRKSTLLRRDQVDQLLMAANLQGELPPPVVQFPVELWTGKQIFSLFVPEGLNMSFKAKLHPPGGRCPGREDCLDDAWVVIRDGELLAGVIDEKAIGAHQAESLFHRIVKDYGADRAREFLDSFTRMLVELITDQGITVGNDNVQLTPEAKSRIREILRVHDEKVERLIDIYRRGEFEPAPGRSVEETLEMRIQEELAEGRDQAGDAASEYLGLDNHAVIMAKTGARGKMLNLAQMAASVGQQSVRGERIHRGLQGRTLPHFTRGDLGSKAHGFIESSYIDGLSPIEFFFHAMGGREGLVDTAVRTSTSGYLQRRLVNALQDIKVEYDGTVRNAEGRIVQMEFGEDGVDPSKSDHGKAVNVDIIVEKVLAKEGK